MTDIKNPPSLSFAEEAQSVMAMAHLAGSRQATSDNFSVRMGENLAALQLVQLSGAKEAQA